MGELKAMADTFEEIPKADIAYEVVFLLCA